MVVQFMLNCHQLLTSVKLAVDNMKWGLYLLHAFLFVLYSCKICYFEPLSFKDINLVGVHA